MEDGDTLHMVQRAPDAPPPASHPDSNPSPQRPLPGGFQTASVSVPAGAVGAEHISRVVNELLGAAGAGAGAPVRPSDVASLADGGQMSFEVRAGTDGTPPPPASFDASPWERREANRHEPAPREANRRDARAPRTPIPPT